MLLKPKEILELARTKEGGEWNAVSPEMCEKLIKFGQLIQLNVSESIFKNLPYQED